MSKAIPTIQKFMTCDPIAIEASHTVAEAQAVMKENKIRHLPVLEGAKVYGIVSERDIHQALSLLNMAPQHMRVADICQTHVYTASPETPLDHVANEMAEHHYGSAVVVQNGKLVGIFTTVDACIALSTLVAQRFH